MTGTSGRPRHDAPTAVRAVGLISGTSMDGIDAAAVEIAEGVPLRAELRAYRTLPCPAEIRGALLEGCRSLSHHGSALSLSILIPSSIGRGAVYLDNTRAV